jgi:hypothetical protein
MMCVMQMDEQKKMCKKNLKLEIVCLYVTIHNKTMLQYKLKIKTKLKQNLTKVQQTHSTENVQHCPDCHSVSRMVLSLFPILFSS